MQKTYTCKECGKRIKVDPSQLNLFEARLCFRCNFWMRYVTFDDSTNRVSLRHKGHHYVAEMDNAAGGPKGYGGALFVIEMLEFDGHPTIGDNGRIMMCGNLWCQGKIPDNFRDRLPDNCRFLTANEVISRDWFRHMGDRRKTISHFS